jgi:hypothetical protein
MIANFVSFALQPVITRICSKHWNENSANATIISTTQQLDSAVGTTQWNPMDHAYASMLPKPRLTIASNMS